MNTHRFQVTSQQRYVNVNKPRTFTCVVVVETASEAESAAEIIVEQQLARPWQWQLLSIERLED